MPNVSGRWGNLTWPWSKGVRATPLVLPDRLIWSQGPLEQVAPLVSPDHQDAVNRAGMAFRQSVSRKSRGGPTPSAPVIPVLAHAERSVDNGDLTAVLSAAGQVGELVGSEGAGWGELAGREAAEGKALAGWMVLVPSGGRTFRLGQLWLTVPLDTGFQGPPVDPATLHWPAEISRAELTNQVSHFPPVGAFPDPALTRAGLLRDAAVFSRNRWGSAKRRYAEGLAWAARTHGGQHRAFTQLERRLWFYLRQMPAPFVWIPQVPIGGRRMDLFCPQQNICVEVDGSSHDNARARADDAVRDVELREMGIKTWRVRNADVAADPAAVANDLARRLAKRGTAAHLRGWTSRRPHPTTTLPPSLAYLAPRMANR